MKKKEIKNKKKKKKIIDNKKKKIKHFLSVDIIIKRLYSYDYSSLIELIDNNWNNMNNPNLLNYHNMKTLGIILIIQL